MFAKFKSKFFSISDLQEDRFDIYLLDAKNLVSKKNYGDSYENALMFLIAHWLTLESRKNSENELLSKNVDGLSMSYASAKIGFENENGNYHKTYYGQRFLELRKANLKHFGVTR